MRAPNCFSDHHPCSRYPTRQRVTFRRVVNQESDGDGGVPLIINGDWKKNWTDTRLMQMLCQGLVHVSTGWGELCQNGFLKAWKVSLLSREEQTSRCTVVYNRKTWMYSTMHHGGFPYKEVATHIFLLIVHYLACFVLVHWSLYIFLKPEFF